jgi:hypothetical protein
LDSHMKVQRYVHAEPNGRATNHRKLINPLAKDLSAILSSLKYRSRMSAVT